MVLVCHVISQVHMTKGSNNFIGSLARSRVLRVKQLHGWKSLNVINLVSFFVIATMIVGI